MIRGGQAGGPDGRAGSRSRVGIAMGLTGIVLHCTFIAFYYFLLAALVAPLYGQAMLFVVWAGLLALGIRWLRGPRPGRSLATPFLGAAAWIVVIILGERVLSWQA